MKVTQKYGQLRKQIFWRVRSRGYFERGYIILDNLDNVKKLDDFARDILKEKYKTNEQNIENVIEKLQRKTVDVMGALSKLWNMLEGARWAEEDAVQISIPYFL